MQKDGSQIQLELLNPGKLVKLTSLICSVSSIRHLYLPRGESKQVCLVCWTDRNLRQCINIVNECRTIPQPSFNVKVLGKECLKIYDSLYSEIKKNWSKDLVLVLVLVLVLWKIQEAPDG